MKFNKIIFVLPLACMAIFGMQSCKKDLEAVVPQDAISTSLALTDPNATKGLYIGVYSRLRNYNATIFNLGEMRSDIWANGLFIESADAGSQQLYTHNISKLNVPYGNWAGLYNLIYQINNVIDVVPKSPVTDPDKTRWLAEMHGIRAYIYYMMLRTWGGVPISTEPVKVITNAAQTYKPRSTPDSVMLLIKSDIEKSLQLFGTNNTLSSGKRVYWNRVATLTLKGDVFLWSGTHMGGGSADYTVAKSSLEEVKALEGASLRLNANYSDIFDPNKKVNNSEIIFALNYEAGQAGQGTFGIFSVNGVQASSYSLSPAATPLVSTTYPFINGANRVGMSSAMINRLTATAGDQRITKSFNILYSSSSPFAVRGVLLSKWLGSTSGSSQIYNNDFPIYRYADVLLLLAEANTKLGIDPSAEINKIRARAWGATAPVFTSGSESANMNAILEEYLREFIGEGRRWWALRRAGDSYVYAAINPTYLSPSSTAKFLLPITVGMMNNDPLLAQTPGY